jgi:hypothetical protein
MLERLWETCAGEPLDAGPPRVSSAAPAMSAPMPKIAASTAPSPVS